MPTPPRQLLRKLSRAFSDWLTSVEASLCECHVLSELASDLAAKLEHSQGDHILRKSVGDFLHWVAKVEVRQYEGHTLEKNAGDLLHWVVEVELRECDGHILPESASGQVHQRKRGRVHLIRVKGDTVDSC